MRFDLNNEEDLKLARILVSQRIEQLLLEKDFGLSKEYLSYVHEYLFRDVFPFAGVYRTMNISKNEDILNGDSVVYADFRRIAELLDYDIYEEKEKGYRHMAGDKLVKRMAHFSSNIWQVHPFLNGNTRTVAVFTQKLLSCKGINVSNEIFKNNSSYFRDALVLSNYYNESIGPDFSYLINFFENVICGRNHELSRIRKIEHKFDI